MRIVCNVKNQLSALMCMFTLVALTACGGGGSGGGSGQPTPTVPDVIVTPPPVVFTVNGTVADEEQAPLEGALVTVDGIQAATLSGSLGQFTVQSDTEFQTSPVVTVAIDGYEPFNQTIALTTAEGDNAFTLDSGIAMAAIDPWGFLEINVTTGGGLYGAKTIVSAEQACDCVINIAGKTSKKGKKKSALYILLVVDVSGSTSDNSIGDKTIFEVEIEALNKLVDNITASDKTHVGIIQFATEAQMTLDFTADLTAVKNALASITPQTSGTAGAATNYQAALELSKTTFANASLKNKDIKTVAFLSDGIPTSPIGSGNTQEQGDRIAAIDAAASVAEDGITVNTFPVNINSKLTTLPTLSAITKGIYFQHDSAEIVEKLPNDSLVGVIGIEIINETTQESALDLILFPDGQFEGSICLTADETNQIKVTPAVCENCEKIAYQKIKVSCEKEECSTCAGQVTNLQLKYTGAETDAHIEVLQRKNANKSYTLFEETLQNGEDFEFYGAARDKTMGSSITIYVNGELNTEIVTSCGQPKIGPGLVSGDFEVVRGYSRNGGLLCPI
jgi:ferredoxin/uncharacterized protein YegL